jgi:hypothetical protein
VSAEVTLPNRLRQVCLRWWIVQGAIGLPMVAPHQGNKTQRSACRHGTKVPAPCCAFAGAAPGENVMAKLINELLLLTCMGAFIASTTYAVTLLH